MYILFSTSYKLLAINCKNAYIVSSFVVIFKYLSFLFQVIFSRFIYYELAAVISCYYVNKLYVYNFISPKDWKLLFEKITCGVFRFHEVQCLTK